MLSGIWWKYACRNSEVSNSLAASFLKLDSYYSAWSSKDKKICIVINNIFSRPILSKFLSWTLVSFSFYFFMCMTKTNKRIWLIQPSLFLLIRPNFSVCSDTKFILNNTWNYLVPPFIIDFPSYIVLLSLCLVRHSLPLQGLVVK